MPRREKPEPRRQQEIMDAAAAVFAEKGFHGASTRDIADRLGIQQAGIYYYFKSKEAALAEVCRIGVEAFFERATAIAESNSTPAEKLASAVVAHLQPFQNMPNYVEVFHSERRYLARDARKPVRTLARKYEKLLEGLFRSGVEDGSFRADLDCRLATLAMLGLCNSVMQWYRAENCNDIDDIARQYATIIVEGVRR